MDAQQESSSAKSPYTRTTVAGVSETMGIVGAGSPCRQSAKAVLEDQIHRVRQQLIGLETLRDCLPTQLSPEQDHKLWSLFVSTNKW